MSEKKHKLKSLDLQIQKDTPVSLHEQMVTQLGMKIAAGVIPAGTKLPSVRLLAKQLDVHYNTCLAVYKELEANSLVEIKQGSGVRVVDVLAQYPNVSAVMSAIKDKQDKNKKNSGKTKQQSTAQVQPDYKSMALQQLSGYFVRHVHEQGWAWPDVLGVLNKTHHRLEHGDSIVTLPPVVVVDKHLDILPLFQTELNEALSDNLDAPVVQATLEQLSTDFKATLGKQAATDANTLFVVNGYQAGTLRGLLEQHDIDVDKRMLVMDVSSGQQEVDLINRLKAGSFLVVASVSKVVLQQAEAVISALRGDELLTRMVNVDEGWEEVWSATEKADAVFGDVMTTPRIEGFSKTKPVCIKAIPEVTVTSLRERMNLR